MKDSMYIFGCIEKNIGDDLFIYTVCNRYPGVRFIISDSAKYLVVNNIKNLEYSKDLRKWLDYSIIETNNPFKKLVALISEYRYRLRLKKRDSVYIVGNAFKNMNYKGRHQLDWLVKRIELSKNFYLLSTNYGPANNVKWKDDCAEVFKKMSDVCFRDKDSYDLFKEMKNVRYAPDAVISLKDYVLNHQGPNIHQEASVN